MTIRRVLGIVTLPLAVMAASAQPRSIPGGFDRAFADLAQRYEAAVRAAGIAGSSLVFVHQGSVVGQHVVGVARADTKRPIDADTIYHWASNTKTLTGIGIMQLRDRGLLAIDDPIVKYIPELRQVHSRFGDIGRITIAHLLAHSGGFQAASWPWIADKQAWQPHEPTEWSQIVAMLPYMETLAEPGTKWIYSNPGYIFLGRIIELVTGDTYETYAHKNLFMPLGMARSYFDRAPFHLLDYLSASYFVKDGVVSAGRFDLNTGITAANGGWNSPIGDFATYAGFLMGSRDPSRQAAYDGVLSRQTLKEMFEPRVEIARVGDAKADMGLSFFLEDHAGEKFVGHSGGQNGFSSRLYVHLASETAYIVAFNTLSERTDKAPTGTTSAVANLVRDLMMKTVFPLFREP